MQIVVDVYSPSGVKLDRIYNIKSASISRLLDGAGSIGIEAFASDERAVERLQNEARVRILAEDIHGVLREVGRGIVRKVKVDIAAGGYSLSLDGPDELDELKRINTLINRAFTLARVEDVTTTLAGLANWSAEVDSAIANNIIEGRFDGASVLGSLQKLVEQQGYHLRAGTSAGVVEIGHFGTDIGLSLINAETLPPEAYTNSSLAFIESINITEDTEAVANRIFVFGAGQNIDAALTLALSTRNTPYVIKQKFGPDNRILYYLEDETSIGLYGVIEKVLTFKEISPLANNTASITTAANMLYDAAVAWLLRNSIKIFSYSTAIKKCEKTVRAGDKVRLVYKGVIEQDGEPYTFRSINQLMWVIKVTESLGGEGQSVRLEVSNVDQQEASAARAVVSAMEQITVQGIKVQPTYNLRGHGPYIEAMDADHDVTVPLTIDDATHTLEFCRLRIKSRAFRATTSAASAGGGVSTSSGSTDTAHTHEVFPWGSDTPSGVFTNKQYTAFPEGGGATVGVNLFTQTSDDFITSTTSLPHTHTITLPDHEHELTYGIHDDDQLPGLITITVNGEVVATGLGTTSEAIEQEFDITDILNDGTLRQTHTVTISCEEGQGTVEVDFTIFEQILPFKMG